MSNYYKVREMTLFLSTIIFFCIVPVVNAENGHTNIKFITESTNYTAPKAMGVHTEEILSGFGVDFYKNFNPESKNVIYKGKSSYEKRLEEQLAKDQNNQLGFPTKSRSKRIKDLEKRLEIEIEKGGQVIPKGVESIGLIFEMKYLGGNLTSSVSSDVINVQKSSFGIGIRIDW